MHRITANPMAARALEIAERKFGLQQLGEWLSASGATLQAWRDGEAVMPQHRFLRLMDLLTARAPGWDETDQI